MLPPFQILHLYWWPLMIGLSYAHFRWSMHLSDRLCSKTRKHPDEGLLKKTERAMDWGMALIVFYVSHSAVISWENVTEALVAWFCGYFMLRLFIARDIQNLRQSRREYEEILRKREQSLAIESRS